MKKTINTLLVTCIMILKLNLGVSALGSIIYDSVITCDEIIDAEAKSHDEETKTVTANFNEKNVTCKAKNFYIEKCFWGY